MKEEIPYEFSWARNLRQQETQLAQRAGLSLKTCENPQLKTVSDSQGERRLTGRLETAS